MVYQFFEPVLVIFELEKTFGFVSSVLFFLFLILFTSGLVYLMFLLAKVLKKKIKKQDSLIETKRLARIFRRWLFHSVLLFIASYSFLILSSVFSHALVYGVSPIQESTPTLWERIFSWIFAPFSVALMITALVIGYFVLIKRRKKRKC